ncbi:hypothetical protein COU56_04375 [Candidatus Pacearchaeota archaeon CG10_big_fil_rev_8_21_14_0_10_31_9]|nr:MAG: hypothetical protein COU56_04375 [Candidatus Pacearchaeota archaeon CG10_big_fil_rev_8_21_14_0_10_31_9]PIZ82534.1 MAG: hypothetical protein COX97_04305 [Candidatus Pacearchaeota archaeon CG_4_10_14_0_2_um_filter_05_32_18]
MAKSKSSKKISKDEKPSKPKIGERGEAWFRIIVAIISGIILNVWKVIVCILSVLNWIVVVFSGKRNKGIANFCEYWNTETYKYIRYLTFVSNQRPFPFSDIERISQFEK